jgi:hypothetical protein
MAYRLSSVQYDVNPGQTRFNIYERALGRIAMAVNGQGQLPNVDYTVLGGATIEWVGSDFTLDPGDVVELQYLTQD